jgi:hypothetical protein
MAAAVSSKSSEGIAKERLVQCELIKEVFANPFRITPMNPSWLSRSVSDCARKVYDQRQFDLLPELASRLEDSGCDNHAILDHCLNGRDHVRGCWVVDLILERK